VKKQMIYRERVAHHEAAHVVMSARSGASVPERGIDVDAPSSVEGARGNAMIHLFEDDPNLKEEDRQKLLMANLAMVCAGAVSDAKIMGRPLREALKIQKGDENVALELLNNSPLSGTKQIAEKILASVLAKVERVFRNKTVWNAVQQLARECLKAGGRLSKVQIENILAPFHLSDREADN
jgi:hypothetical protein